MMKNKIGLVGLVGLMLAVDGCGQKPRPETAAERLERWRLEFKQAASETASNEVVGITRIVRVDTVDFDEDIHKWSGRIVAEHVNRVGGIERTNLLVKAQLTLADTKENRTHIYSVVDRAAMFQETMERLKAEAEAVRQSAPR